MKEDHFWDEVAKGLVEVGMPFEDKSSDSPEESKGFKTLFNDSTDGRE